MIEFSKIYINPLKTLFIMDIFSSILSLVISYILFQNVFKIK